MALLTHPNARELTKSVRATVLVFNDPRSQELLTRIERLAPSEANALITGETGTGKELVARHIHNLSRRSKEPFVAVNCGSFPETLVESELFGHEKGAFTGATSSKAGWFETAKGGTLFLDEIGDLPLNMQVKLLRVLQEREVVRLGSRTPIPINVRLVAATNVNLADAVVAGHFREDLFYRLHVATIRLPPLRERPGDTLPLAEFFLEQHCQRLGYQHATLSPEAERKLLSHSWPGNIRELENAIHHALLVCRHQVVQPDDLQLADLRSIGIRQEAAAQLTQAPLAPANLEAALTALFESNLPDLYEHIEEVVFRTAYRFCHGNQLQTGRLLNISRNIVRARLEKIGEISACGIKGAIAENSLTASTSTSNH
ncbi:sigma-54-dependent Fis family transcriptional regulator [Pseudomonas sp.]|uniref:sigma-54 interaction domain-containing protein n=1 Tax=Pseudomonas sp. TaxID=306 RepID=UPI002631EFDB|nr:sigma-54 dependent transcriptional regulator [Pseudomonas sp.]